MSLFGSLLGGDDDDLFFGRQMRQMNSLMNSLMPDPFNMLTPFDNFGANSMRSPTGLFGFPGLNTNFNRLLNGDIPESNGAAFCSSSVIQMTSGPDGRPQIYQASSSTKTGPGGVRETRKTIQDSRTGVKKMAIGHHIGERGHIIEKEQNLRSGELQENQEYINLDEEEAEDFDREFTNKVRGRRVLEITDVSHPNRHNHHRQLPALPAPPTSSSPSSGANTTTSSTSSDNCETTTATSANKTAEIKISSTTSNNSASNNLSTQRRQLLSSRNLSKINSRRPLRTPSSSPLASNTPSTSSSSIHPHPYNVSSSARRNYRLKNHHNNKNSNSQSNSNNNPNNPNNSNDN